jgi:hypothetical protein
MRALAVFFILLFTTSATQADWAPGALEWEKGFDAGPVKFTNSFVLMTWGALKNQGIHNIHDHTWFIPDSHFRSGGLHVEVELQRKPDLSIKTAPLIITLAGIFSGYKEGGARRTTQDYGRRGYHVIYPPNPWSKDFIREVPHFNPGSLKEEAAVMLSILDSAIEKIGVEHISRIEIEGESYGALLASAVFQMDQARAQPKIDGSLTLMSPPLDMNQAIANLDLGIDRTQALYYEQCTGKETTLSMGESLIFHSVQSKMGEKTLLCSEPLVFHSFQDRLVESIELLHELKNVGTIPEDKVARTQWEKDFRFAMVVPEFTPENAVYLKDGTVSLLHWLSLLPPSSLSRVRVLTAQDDFLNVGLSWPVGAGIITPQNLMELPWGGHTGYLLLSEYQGLLDAGFNY